MLITRWSYIGYEVSPGFGGVGSLFGYLKMKDGFLLAPLLCSLHSSSASLSTSSYPLERHQERAVMHRRRRVGEGGLHDQVRIQRFRELVKPLVTLLWALENAISGATLPHFLRVSMLLMILNWPYFKKLSGYPFESNGGAFRNSCRRDSMFASTGSRGPSGCVDYELLQNSTGRLSWNGMLGRGCAGREVVHLTLFFCRSSLGSRHRQRMVRRHQHSSNKKGVAGNVWF